VINTVTFHRVPQSKTKYSDPILIKCVSAFVDPCAAYSYALDERHFVSVAEPEPVYRHAIPPLRRPHHAAAADEHAHEEIGQYDGVQDNAELLARGVVREEQGEERGSDGAHVPGGQRRDGLPCGAPVERGAVRAWDGLEQRLPETYETGHGAELNGEKKSVHTLLMKTPSPLAMQMENEPSVVGAWCASRPTRFGRVAMLMMQGSV
jgi:hypothetical protein